MKKTLSVVILSGMLILSAIPASAQTTDTSSLNAQIQALLDQVKKLQTQLETLKTAQGQVQTAVAEVKSTLTLIRSLREGMTGDDVKTLQAILASDPEVYPEGLITGFYGPMTSRAVMKFQAKSGIEQVGVVGPKTLVSLNGKLKGLSLAQENVGGENRPCVPPGHLIAPGWLKKNNQTERVVPECLTKIPTGISNVLEKRFPTSPTPTPDTTAPVISNIAVSSLASTSAVVKWDTNENATTKLWYGTSNPLNLTTASVASSSVLVKMHSVSLNGLSASTTYYFLAVSSDSSGNSATSTQFSFETLAE